MTAPISELVAYRLQRARESVQDARILADASRWNAAVNRLYYACFYVAAFLTLEHERTARAFSRVAAARMALEVQVYRIVLGGLRDFSCRV